MKISSKGDYALRTLLTLAQLMEEKRPVRLPEIADRNGIPVKFLEQIMIQLRGAGLVVSRRGRYGGYQLAKDPEKITLGEVIRLIDGTVAPVGCVGRTEINGCSLRETCVLKDIFHEIHLRIGEIIDNTTFRDLCDRAKRNGNGRKSDLAKDAMAIFQTCPTGRTSQLSASETP
jgi:Rrf2 family protein